MKKLTKLNENNTSSVQPKDDVPNIFGKRALPVDMNAKKLKNAKV